MKSYDVIVIGAGHNGMIAAATLSRKGLGVLLLEASPTYGGMAAGGEFAPGYAGPSLVHSLNGITPAILKEMQLDKFGLAPLPTMTTCLSHDDAPLLVADNYQIAAGILSREDEVGLAELTRRLKFQASILQQFLADTPPQEGAFPFSMKARLAKTAFNLKRSGKIEMQEFMRMALMCICDVVDEHISDERLKGLLAFDGTLGISLGPRSPTSLFGLYMRLATRSAGADHTNGYSINAAGRLIDAIYESTKAAGVEFGFGRKVRAINVNNGLAGSVETTDGETYSAGSIVSAIHPATTFLSFVGAPKLDTGFSREISSVRSRGNVSKLNLVLDRFPHIASIGGSGEGRYVLAPSANEVERNFNPSKYGELPDAPCFEFVIGKGDRDTVYLSAIIQNTPLNLKQGWESGSKRLQDLVVNCLERLAPGIKSSIVATRFFSPLDIESNFNVPGGHWHHGELQVDRLFSLRPVFGAANYRSPIDNLYICGAGTHPGGGLSGMSGLNVARALIRDKGRGGK